MRFHDCDEFHTSLLDFLWGRDQISNPFLWFCESFWIWSLLSWKRWRRVEVEGSELS
jgi:hypothetical protein